MTTQQTDVCIIGAGPGGAMAALFLAKKGIASVLVDKSKFPRDKICGDAFSGKVLDVLKRLDPQIAKEVFAESIQVPSYGVNFVSPKNEVLRVPFGKDAKNLPHPPGFVSKRKDFDNYLVELCRKEPLIELLEEVEFREFERLKNGYLLKTKSSGKSIEAKMVIAADGAYSAFAKKVANFQVAQDENCFGLRAYYENVQGLDKDNFIELHFLKDFLPGYFWIFPLPNNQANIGVGLRSDVVSKKKINLKKAFQNIIENHPAIKERFANATLVDGIKLFPLPTSGKRKKSISGDNYLLIGDAAGLIDPFTGEGIGHAMKSGMLAADQAAKCLEAKNFSATFNAQYDAMVYRHLWSELRLSKRMQQLVAYPWLFNFVINKAANNPSLNEMISCMFDDLDMRKRLKQPSFYFKLLFN